jgi:predicted amidohydrolase
LSRTLPILAVQTAPVAWDLSATWDKFASELRTLHASYPLARLFLYPELFLAAIGGMHSAAAPSWSKQAAAEPIPGPITDRLGELAREMGIWLLPGSIYERGEDGRIYNTALAFAPDGSLRARYRKVFPWRPWESPAAGSEFVIFEIEGIGRAGLMICYDGWFPEVPRQLAWLGAEVIFQVTATPTSDRDQEIVLARANAIVNQVYLVNVNMGGRPGPGRSVIVDAEGHLLQQAGDGEEYLSEVLDLDTVTRVRRSGSVAMNRMWAQLDDEGSGIYLPMYGGTIRQRPSLPEVGDRDAAERSLEGEAVLTPRY